MAMTDEEMEEILEELLEAAESGQFTFGKTSLFAAIEKLAREALNKLRGGD